MHIRAIFWLLALPLTVTLAFISVRLFKGEDLIILFVVEAMLLFVLVMLFILYRRAVLPLNNIAKGFDLIKEQNFNTQLSYTGHLEADKVVKLFNGLIEQLKNDRLRVREQNYFLDLLVDASPLGVIILDLDGRVEMLNSVAMKMLRPYQKGDTIKREDSMLSSVIAGLKPTESKTVRLNNAEIYKCTHRTFIDRGFYRSFYLIEVLTQVIFESEKQAYEQVIRTISHEVNNTMGGVTCTLNSVNYTLVESYNEAELAELVQMTSDRCYNLSRFISSLSDVVRIPDPELRSVSLNNMVSNIRIFAESLCKKSSKDIELRLELCDHSPVVLLDEVLFEQVLLNIIKNAIEAISDSGLIVVSIKSAPIELTIANNGAEISEREISCIFTPFFTTKSQGQGIGLMFVRTVLQKHDFKFSLQTNPDGWTRFNIRF